MNSKGFNLFTALISFLLIMLAVLLIQSMIQTERNAIDTISRIESRSKLEATAEMARADAMQVFNYALRKRIEDWLTDPERGGITLQLENRTWKQIQDEFAASKFGGDQGSQFAKFTASSLEGIFYSPDHLGKYRISLEGSETLEDGITSTILKSIDEDFFTVIGCDGDPRGDHCPLGTFYVNLHIEKLTQEEYENLPKLHVVDMTTGEELKEIILPRTTFRIYVPLRFFKAIAETRALTHYPRGGGDFSNTDPWINTPNDYGIFSPRVHNEMEAMGLGMCDFGYCAPRTDPLKKPESREISRAGTFCPGDSTSATWGEGLNIQLESSKTWFPANLTSYNANDNDDWKNMKDSLSMIGEAKVCNVINGAREAGFIDANPDDDFTLVGNECARGEEMLAYEISINSDARASKIVGPKESISLGLTDPGRNLGLYTDPRTGDVNYPHIGGIEYIGCRDSDADFKSRCAEIKSVKVTLAFREENQNYMVRELSEGEERIYKISVYDNTYIPFTANWEQGEIGADFLYRELPELTSCSMAAGQGWYCYSEREAGPAPPVAGGSQTTGCSSPASHTSSGSIPRDHDD